MEVRDTRSAITTDGVYLAYQAVGEGPLDLVWQFDHTGDVDLVWESPLMECLDRAAEIRQELGPASGASLCTTQGGEHR